MGSSSSESPETRPRYTFSAVASYVPPSIEAVEVMALSPAGSPSLASSGPPADTDQEALEATELKARQEEAEQLAWCPDATSVESSLSPESSLGDEECRTCRRGPPACTPCREEYAYRHPDPREVAQDAAYAQAVRDCDQVARDLDRLHQEVAALKQINNPEFICTASDVLEGHGTELAKRQLLYSAANSKIRDTAGMPSSVQLKVDAR
ncbi:hypothetical protein FOCC_FOCC015304 [Frankliniella occidentalis]|nr:hypothetical protein FOCC_FOCC015304 [Frankliniella occidentalis]